MVVTHSIASLGKFQQKPLSGLMLRKWNSFQNALTQYDSSEDRMRALQIRRRKPKHCTLGDVVRLCDCPEWKFHFSFNCVQSKVIYYVRLTFIRVSQKKTFAWAASIASESISMHLSRRKREDIKQIAHRTDSCRMLSKLGNNIFPFARNPFVWWSWDKRKTRLVHERS